MKSDDSHARSLRGPDSDTASLKDLRQLIHDRDVLIDELRASLSEAVNRAVSAEASDRDRCNNVPLANLVVDNKWRITDANRAAALLWDRKREELLGVDLWSLLGKGRYGYANLYAKALRENRTIDFEHFCAILKKWLRISATPCVRGLSLWFEDTHAPEGPDQRPHQALAATEGAGRQFSRHDPAVRRRPHLRFRQ